MKYHELICKYFGEYAEDVLKLEKLILAGNKEMASYITINIPNYEKKMLEVFKEYYPMLYNFMWYDYTIRDTTFDELGVLPYFFEYHFLTEFKFLVYLKVQSHKTDYFIFWAGLKSMWSRNKELVLELPKYLTTFSLCDFPPLESITVVNARDLEFLNEIHITKGGVVYMPNLPNPRSLEVGGDGRISNLNGIDELHKKITKLTIIPVGAFSESIMKFNNLTELTIESRSPIVIDSDFEFPYIPSLKINNTSLPNSKTAFNNFHFVEVSYYFSCSNSDIKKMLDMGFEYESTRQCNGVHYVTYKNTRF